MNEQLIEAPARTGSATRGQVEAFCRAMVARSEHRFDCWLCGGQKRTRPSDGRNGSRPCGECKGKGTENER